MQGQYADAETGLYYNTFRYYDPDIGRLVSEDPVGLWGGLNFYEYAPNTDAWIDPWGWLKCGLTGNEVNKASDLPVIKPGTKEWNNAVSTIRQGGKSNFRTSSEKDAVKLVKQGRGEDIKRMGSSADPYSELGAPYKKGYEIHPNESHLTNSPGNDLQHVKWKDWTAGRSQGGKGHVFF